MPRPMHVVTPVLPSDVGVHEGLAFSLWLPEPIESTRGGVVIIHGAGSCKENHHDFARGALAAGFAAIAYDQRGHGSSDGPMDGRALRDVAEIASVLRSAIDGSEIPVALRGSSLGGYLAVVAAPLARASAVIAICPASGEGLQRGLASGELGFDADVPVLERLLTTHDLHDAVESLEIPVLLLHAEGDERVPVQHSRELANAMSGPGSRLITVPGGHHRSIQHDPELRAISLRWLERALG